MEYKITDGDFKNIHNGLYHLRRVQEAAGDLLSERLMKDINKALEYLEKGTKSVYDQERKHFNDKMDYFALVQEDNGFKSVWSINKVDDIRALSGYTGKRVKVNGEIFLLKNSAPSWLELWEVVDHAIVTQNDHHVFIEQFEQEDKDTIVVWLGS